MDAQADLGSQQKHLASIDYDLRITNLARFIHKKIRNHFRHEGDNLSLIDIGAGNGLFLKFFKSHGLKVTGIEYEQNLVDKMKKDPMLKNIPISQGDITKVKGNEEYDVVIASDVIEHIKDHEKAIQHLWTFVAPGGILIITVPAHSFLYGKRDEAWGHFRRYDKRTLINSINYALSSRAKRGDLYEIASSSRTPRNDNNYTIQFVTFWNFVGFFAYYLYEKILHKQINEEIRYSKSFKSKIVRTVLDSILKVEEFIGGSPLGLTLVAGVKKKL